MGTLFLVLYSAYGLGFWYGGKLTIEEGYTVGDVMLVFFGMLTGAFSLSAAANNIEYFAKARVAAHAIFEIIDRKTPIDPLAKDGEQPDIETLKAEVTIENISFTYPARLDHQVRLSNTISKSSYLIVFETFVKLPQKSMSCGLTVILCTVLALESLKLWNIFW